MKLLQKISLRLIILLLPGIVSLQAQSDLIWQEMSVDLPEGIKGYKTSGNIAGDTITAYYTITDISSGRYAFFPLYAEKNKKPGEYVAESAGDIILLTNGGFFGADVSYSLVMNNYQTLAPNIRAVVRPYNNENYTYYPTRGSFGVSSMLTAEATWTYTMQDNNQTYAYPVPGPNTLDALPKPQPSPSFPEGGKKWHVSEAIGGGPLLIKDSTIISNYEPELFYQDIISTKAPRTAVGRTSKGEIINLVVDGRQSHSNGATLQTLAEILLALGCTDAINLDGGGSSVMMIGDQIVNEPSDGNTRSIPSVVAIKKAVVLDTENPEHFHLQDSPADSLATGFGQSKTILLEAEASASYYFHGIKPARYRLEIYLNKEEANQGTDSLALIIWRKGIALDTCIIDQTARPEGFIIAGEYWLAGTDSLRMRNEGTGAAHIDAIRLIKTTSGRPEIDFVPQVYGNIHTKGDTIKLVTQAISQLEERPIIRYTVYETTGVTNRVIAQNTFAPTVAYLDSFTYVLNKMQGSVKLTAWAVDNLNDSAGISYTINIDDSPPNIWLGRESVLDGSVTDTIHLMLLMSAAREIRPLKNMKIIKNPELVSEVLDTFTLSGIQDTVFYAYRITPGDESGFTLKALVTDVAGYNAEWSYRFLPSTDILTDREEHARIFYDAIHSLLHIHVKDQQNNSQKSVMITNLQGKIMQSALFHHSHIQMNVANLPKGMYIAVMQGDNQAMTHKFVVTGAR